MPGGEGGEIIGVGYPKQQADNPRSHTGQFVRPILGRRAASVA